MYPKYSILIYMYAHMCVYQMSTGSHKSQMYVRFFGSGINVNWIPSFRYWDFNLIHLEELQRFLPSESSLQSLYTFKENMTHRMMMLPKKEMDFLKKKNVPDNTRCDILPYCLVGRLQETAITNMSYFHCFGGHLELEDNSINKIKRHVPSISLQILY